MNRRVPFTGTWLLRHFDCSPQNEQVIGDLVEKYQQVQSAGWYWRQVFIASITDLRLHKLLVTRGVLIGIAFQAANVFSTSLIMRRLFPYRHAWEHPNVLIADFLIIIVGCGVGARLLAR